MLYAQINDNPKAEPLPHQKAKCRCCGRDVISRCGELKIWHWAHTVKDNCDNWYEPETQWHRNWKKVFGLENSEVIFERDGIKHIADVFTHDSIVIELQNSPISTLTIKAREEFYGEKMLWIINAAPFRNNFDVSTIDPLYEKIYPNNFFYSSEIWKRAGWFLDFEDIVPEEEFLRFIKLFCGFTYIPSINKYFRATSTDFRWNKFVVGKVKKFNEENGIDNRDERIKYFTWNHAWKSWTAAERPTFIDYNFENLFYVQKGLGTRYGSGLIISKKTFLSKYKLNH